MSMPPLLLNRRNWIAATLGSALMLTLHTPDASAAEDARLFELRVYVCNEGKLPDLLARFRDHTIGLFEKHGIENIGYWVPVEKEDGADTTLYYLIAHKSREGADAAWAQFRNDPDWKAAAKASEANGKILAKKPDAYFLKGTDFSCPITKAKGNGERVFELRTYTTPEGKLSALHDRFRNHTMALFSKHGMGHVGYWTPVEEKDGHSNKLLYILSHSSKAAGLKSFESFRADPAWIAAKAESEKGGPLTLAQPEGVKSVYLKATDFSPIR